MADDRYVVSDNVKVRIADLVAEHPDWTSDEVAAELAKKLDIELLVMELLAAETLDPNDPNTLATYAHRLNVGRRRLDRRTHRGSH